MRQPGVEGGSIGLTLLAYVEVYRRHGGLGAMEGEMPIRRRTTQLIAVAFIGCLSSSTQAASELSIAQNESIFVDGKTFQLVLGKAKADPSSLLKELGAREMGSSALIFRIDEKLYIIDAPLISLRGGSVSAEGKTVFSADQAHTDRINVEYVLPKNRDHQYLYDLLKERRA